MKRILIADDEPNIVVSLEFLMKQRGHAVRIARTGEEALAAIREFAPDLVLLDVMMPQRSGYEVCQKLREDPSAANVKVIMLSAKSREVEIDKGMAVGADAYVTKPFSTRDLITLVESMLGD